METSLTIFKSIFDNKTDRQMTLGSYDAFEDMLYGLAKQPGYKPKKDERFNPAASPLISPAIFNKGDLRRNVNVKCWGGWAALDVDEYESTFDKALESFRDIRFTCYSSASSTKEKPKFRVVIPLSENVQAVDIRHFWYSLSKEFNSLGDPQTKDLSRMYYVPAQYPGAYNFIVSNKTAPILSVYELLKKYDYAREKLSKSFTSQMPEAIQKKVAAYRKERLNNTSYKWSGLNDCPFVNKDLVIRYKTITGTGWYRAMFSLMLSIASTAMLKGYPITANEIAKLCKELDDSTGSWYKDRDMITEADRAIAYACKAI